MNRLEKALNLEKPDVLVNQLLNAGYSFAAWRMPDQKDTQFIISLREVEPIEDFQLSECSTGFVVNEYAHNHPIKPFFIPADLTLSQNVLNISEQVQSSAIDAFIDNIKEVSKTWKSSAHRTTTSENVDFAEQVKQAVEEIKAGSFEKVVLSRFKDESIPSGFSIWEFFTRILEKYPKAFCSLSFIPGKGIWLGATPELLLSNDSNQFKTVALAGTKHLENGQSLGEIAWTQKEIEEQALVSRYIINCFKKIRLREFHEHGPKTMQAGNLTHLKTEFVVDYQEVHFDDLANQMLELLHPTSAVCGMPIEFTKPWIKKVEGYDREFYSGFLGPVNFKSSTNLFVNLRCLKVANNSIRLFAGAGITEDSDPQKEFIETEMKMSILKSLL